jgi:hypothetical protein
MMASLTTPTVEWQEPMIGTSYFRHLLLASIDEDVTKHYFVDRLAFLRSVD